MYYFVSENIFAYNSGTEHAQAQRVKFFNRQATQGRLGQASYVTRDYNRFLSRDANAIGLNADEVLNMYDYFRERLMFCVKNSPYACYHKFQLISTILLVMGQIIPPLKMLVA